jgi:hypothetical protein
MSTKDANYRREVKLSGEALKRFRALEGTTFKGLNEMAALIFETMEGSSKRRDSLKTARFAFGPHVLCVTDGEGNCACYDSKTGVCRPCTGDELSSH